MVNSATDPPSAAAVDRPERTPAAVVAACLTPADGDRDAASLLSTAAGIKADSVADTDALLERLPETDCVVYQSGATDADDPGDVLAALRERDAAVPFVLLTAAPDRATVDAVLEHDWTDVVVADAAEPGSRLANRVRATVSQRETLEHARQALAAVDAVRDGVAVVDGDGVVALANGSFARQFGATASSLRDTHWEELFADDAVERLTSDALAAVADGWEWIGTCEGFRVDEKSIPLQVRVSAVADEGFVLVVSRPQADGHE